MAFRLNPPLRRVPSIKELILCDYVGKADLSKGCGNPKRKFGVTTKF